MSLAFSVSLPLSLLFSIGCGEICLISPSLTDQSFGNGQKHSPSFLNSLGKWKEEKGWELSSLKQKCMAALVTPKTGYGLDIESF